MKFQKVIRVEVPLPISGQSLRTSGPFTDVDESAQFDPTTTLPNNIDRSFYGYRALRFICVCFLLMSVKICSAQRELGVVIKSQFIKDWQRAKTYTDAFLDAMPADKFNFRPNDTFMTFTEQMLHLAQYNYNLGAEATGAANPYDKSALQKRTAGVSKDAVIKIVNASYDFVLGQLDHLQPEKLSEPTDGTTRFHILEKAYEHQTHHRGSLAVYLRLAGVTPPHEMLY